MTLETGEIGCGAEEQARPGSLWTVPAVSGTVVIMSRPHRRAAVCYYYALPLYTSYASVGAHSALDFLIDGQESTLDVALYGAFWNARPLPGLHLGQEIGRITDDQLLVDLYLLRGGVEIDRPAHWRLGHDAVLTPAVVRAREAEVKRWVHMTSSKAQKSLSNETATVVQIADEPGPFLDRDQARH